MQRDLMLSSPLGRKRPKEPMRRAVPNVGLGSDLGKHMKLRRKKVGNARLSDLDM